MSNISLLIVKPESVAFERSIDDFLTDKNYSINKKIKKENFSTYAKQLYRLDGRLDNEFVDFISKSYDEEYEGKFLVYIVSKDEGNVFDELVKDTGKFIDYQTNIEDTLRYNFGLRKDYNKPFSDKYTLAFNGFHKVDNEKHLQEHLEVLDIKL